MKKKFEKVKKKFEKVKSSKNCEKEGAEEAVKVEEVQLLNALTIDGNDSGFMLQRLIYVIIKIVKLIICEKEKKNFFLYA